MSRVVDKITFGGARRRRRMARLLAQLDKLPADVLPTGPSGGSSYRPPRRHLRSGLRAIATLTVWVLLIGGVIYLARMGNHKSHSAAPQAQGFGQDANHSSGSIDAGSTAPSPGVDEHSSRILPAPAVPAGTGGYKFLQLNNKVPVAYDPCRPIHYVLRDHDTPPGGDATVRQAVAAVSKATGLSFIYDGLTTEVPAEKRAAYLPSRYPGRWAPVLIGWTDPKETPSLVGDRAGYGGSSSVSKPGELSSLAYVSGRIALDAPQFAELGTRPDGAAIMLQGVEHELGHLVGLDHVNDPTQVMNPVGGSAFNYAAGDLRGLAQEGRGACHPEL